MAIIEVSHVTKEYRLGQIQSLKQTVERGLARLRGERLPERVPFKALDDVSFEVQEGEVLGIIGSNGAGKSTLLKLLAGITRPTKGNISVRGSVAPLIEVGSGLIGDLTGRENVFLNGTILGLSRATIRKKFDEIVAFAELEEFIDTPIKRYSSGMAVRLGFAIATSVDADILIVDEVLAVGDLAFQRKCFDRMEDMIKRQGKTVLLVSHNIRQVERLCTRVALLDSGRVVDEGMAHKVCSAYYEKSNNKVRSNRTRMSEIGMGKHKSSGEVEVRGVSIASSGGWGAGVVGCGERVVVTISMVVRSALTDVTFGIGVHTIDFFYLATNNTEDHQLVPQLPPGDHVLRCVINEFPFLPNVYCLRFGITAGTAARTVFYGENLCHFQVVPPVNKEITTTGRDGFVALDVKWHLPHGECGATGRDDADEDVGAALHA